MSEQEIAVTVDGTIGGPDAAGTFTMPPDVVNEDPAEIIRRQLAESNASIEAEKARREAAERGRGEAEARALALQEEARQARQEAAEGQVDIITTGLSAAQAEKQAALDEMERAYESGDAKKQALAADKLSMANAKIMRLEEGKAEAEARKSAPRTEPARPTDPVEAFAAGRAPRTANWIRANPQFVTDPAKSQQLQRAHFKALGDGVVEGSEEYFQHVEGTLGMREPHAAQQHQQAPRRSAAPPVAPVNGGGAAPSLGNAPTEVRLTQSEALAAQDGTHVWNYDDPTGQKRWRKGDPIGLKEFARRKNLMRAQYDRSALEQ